MIFPQTRPFFGGKGWRIFFFSFFKLCCPWSYYYVTLTKKIRFYHMSNNFGRLPPGQFSLDFKKNFGFGLFKPISTTYLRASESGKLDDSLIRPPLPILKCFALHSKNLETTQIWKNLDLSQLFVADTHMKKSKI